VTKKELLAKRGLSSHERQAIFLLLKRHRQVNVTSTIAICYATLRRQYPILERNDALIAAASMVRQIPLLIGNVRHFRLVAGLELFLP
jgi:predicted nucleic acid-binding protein